jgi:hypothetical protein
MKSVRMRSGLNAEWSNMVQHGGEAVSWTRDTSGHSLGTPPHGPRQATTVLGVCIIMNFQGCGQDSRKGNGYLTRASHLS